MQKHEWVGNPILIDFGSIWEPSWRPKMEPRGSKSNTEMESKFDRFLKASWNTIFSAKMRQRGARDALLASARRNAQLAWGGLWRGIRQEPLSQELGPRRLAERIRRP